jgi:lipoprotein NlpI
MQSQALSITRFFSVVFVAFWSVTQVNGFFDELEKPAISDSPDLQIEKLNKELAESLAKQLRQIDRIDPANADAVNQYSARGDTLMFLGEFEKAEADYLQMVKLQPDLDSSHWRLGIAMFFAKHPKQAASQFDKYNSFDNVDRENGIWRYLSHYRAFGKDEARKQLLRYEKDDRPPFKEVYRLFDGSLSAEEVLKAVPDDPADASRDSRLFYSHLYIGLNQVVEGNTDEAKISLRNATLNPWPRKAGFGPNYMWHIGRLQHLELQKVKAAP